MRATVEHLPSGARWMVETPDHRPSALRRTSLRGPFDDHGWTPCVGCGAETPRRAMVVFTPPTERHPNGRAIAVAPGQADRIVRDHPAFRVDGDLGYGPATVANVCSGCNGSEGRHVPRTLRHLESRALELLNRHATILTVTLSIRMDA
jgi:hypothetical protein